MISKSGLAIVIFALSGLFTSAESGPIPGDINGDGIVDFADFLIFAQNFGKTGDPFTPGDPPATVYDTVVVFVQQLAPPPAALEIPGLESISITSYWVNWDAEPELDGIRVLIRPQDRFGNNIANWIPPRYDTQIPMTVEVALYTDNNRDGNPDSERKVYSGKFQGTAYDFIDRNVIQIPKDQILADPLKDYKWGVVEVTLTTPR